MKSSSINKPPGRTPGLIHRLWRTVAKPWALALLGCLAIGTGAQAQLFTIDFATSSPNQIIDVFGNDLTVSNVSVSSGSISYNSFSSTFGGTPFAESSAGWTASDALSAKNFSFDVTANSGTFDLTGFDALFRATGAGPTAASLIINDTVINTKNAPDGNDSFSETLNLTGLTSATIEIAGWDNDSRTSSGGGAFRIAGIEGFGTMGSTSFTSWTGTGGGGTWQDGAAGNFGGNYEDDLANTVTFGGTGEDVATSGTPEAGSLTFSADGYDVQDSVQLGIGDVEVTNAGDTATISADISGDGGSGLAKSGDGTLVLSGNNSFTGATTVETGTLEVQSTNALGTTAGGTTVDDGATLALSGNVTTAAEALTINGTGDNGAGALRNIGDDNTYAGAVTLGSNSTITSDADTLTVSGGIDTSGNDLSFNGSGDTTVATSGISGSGAVDKSGSGTLALDAAGTYSGGTSISEGTVRVGNDTGLGTGGVEITDGNLLSGAGVNVGNDITVASPNAAVTVFTETFSNSSGFTVTQGGLGEDGTNDYFQITDGSNIAPTYTGNVGDFLAGQDIDDGGWTGSDSPSQLEWTGIDISNTSDLEFEGLFASEATDKIDSSDFLLVQYQIDDGGYQDLLAFQNDGSTFNTRFSQDTDFNGVGDGANLTAAFAAFSNSIAGTGSTLDLRFTAAVDSGGEDFAADEFIITGLGTGTGGNAVIGSDITSGTAEFSGDITLEESVNLTAASGGTTEISGAIEDGTNGAQGIDKIGAGTVALSGTNTYTGETVVSAGTLLINGDNSAATGNVTVESGATLGGTGTIGGDATINGNLQPGESPGIMDFSADLTLASTANTTVEINGSGARGTDFDGIDVGVALSYDGTLTLDLGTTFGVGNYVFELFDFGSESGEFSAIDLAGNYAGSLSGNGDVWSMTDGDDTWTFTHSTGNLGLDVIPEPSTWVLIGIGFAMILWRTRRRQSMA
jgi:autotransporter-associated beta strand protein